MNRIQFQLKRPFLLMRTIQILAKCRVWMLYVADPLKLAMIRLLVYGAILAYQSLKYSWMPNYSADF